MTVADLSAASKPPHRAIPPLRRAGGGALAVLPVLLLACASGGGQPAKLPPQTVTEPGFTAPPEGALTGAGATPLERAGEEISPPAAPQGEAATEDASGAEPAEAGPQDEGDPTLIVIGRGDAEGRGDSRTLLRRASSEERARRQHSAPPSLVLTDDNLAEKARGGRLTLGSPQQTPEPSAGEEDRATAGTASQGEGAADDEPAAFPDGISEDERYWRSRVLEVRRRWRQAFDDIPRLEGEVERLRTAFYSEDDPVRRDRQIKPLWDRALDRLRETQEELRRAPEELEVLLAEGVRAGAQPGWLREGIELEPPLPPRDDDERALEETDPGEPVLAEPPRDPPPSL